MRQQYTTISTMIPTISTNDPVMQFSDDQLFLQTLADYCCFDVAQLHQLGIDDDDMADNVFVPAAQSTGDDFNLLSVGLCSLHVVL